MFNQEDDIAMQDHPSDGTTRPVNRIANLQHVAELAIRVLGPHRGAAWLSKPHVQLGGIAPIDDLETSEGLCRVEALLSDPTADF